MLHEVFYKFYMTYYKLLRSIKRRELQSREVLSVVNERYLREEPRAVIDSDKHTHTWA